MGRIAVLQNCACEHGGVFESALTECGHRIDRVRLFDGIEMPAIDDFDAWLIMGGPMNVDDTSAYPWLLPERQLVADLIKHHRPVLGICLGAQLIARAAGANVYAKRPKEIGLFAVELTDAAAADPVMEGFKPVENVFQWHGDTFDLPEGAAHLARSARFEHQAFRLGDSIYGLQFHLECTFEMVQAIGDTCRAELEALPESERSVFDGDHLVGPLRAQNCVAKDFIQRWSQHLLG
jgi:GMP synthase-like glutamine amidotransferase